MSDDTHRQSLAHYPVHTLEKLRYADTDRQGHVNNAVFATLVEAGRVTFLYDPKRPLTPPGTQFVIAELTIRFLSELNWPGEVTVGTGVARIGNGSFVLEQAIVNGDYCAATARSVIVLMDEQTRRSTPLPQASRDVLAGLQVKN